MPLIVTRSPWTRQPQYAVGISSLWKPIVGFLSNPGWLESIDLATEKKATAYGSITNSPGLKGIAGFASSASDTRYSWDTKPVSSYNNGYAVLVLANPSSGAAVNRFCVIGDEAPASYTTATMAFNSNAGSSLSSGSTAIFEYSSGFTASAEASGTVDGLWHAYIFNRQAGTVAPKIYVDGVNKTTSSTGATGASATVGIHTHGAPVSTSAGYTNGIALAVVFTRSLTDQEIVGLSVNPWQIFAPLKRGIWVPSAGGNTYNMSVSESASAADALSAAAAFARSVTEAATATDAPTYTAVLVAAVSESATATDAVSAGAGNYSVTASESASASDTVTAISTLVVSLSEAGAAADSASATAVLLATVSETASATDATNWGGAVYGVSLSETATATDAIAAAAQFLAAQAEAGNATDGLAVVASFGAQQVEAATALDAVQAARTTLALLTEAGVAVDSVAGVTGQIYSASIAEAVAAADLVAVQSGPLVVVMSAAPLNRRADGARRPAQLSTGRRVAPSTGYRS